MSHASGLQPVQLVIDESARVSIEFQGMITFGVGLDCTVGSYPRVQEMLRPLGIDDVIVSSKLQ